MKAENYIGLIVLGQIYGVNARDVGTWLKNLSLRHPDGRPTRDAVQQGLVQERSLEYGGCFWHWHEQKTCAILDGMGYKRASQQAGEQHDGFVLYRGS
ncbi:MAG TPA: hypothetical protein VH592_10495 [Gemmataceae bacterium]|jgi:hypothetical protein